MRTAYLIPVILTVTAGTATAQAERYELGQRLRQFETAWEKHTDPAARKRALAILPKLTNQLLTGQQGEAGRTLDEARFALESSDPPSEAVRWLTALYAVPETRLLLGDADELKVEVRAFYAVKGDVPEGATATLRLGEGQPVAVSLEKLPAAVILKAPDSEGWTSHPVVFETSLAGKTIGKKKIAVARLSGNLAENLHVCQTAAHNIQKTAPTAIEGVTLEERVELLSSLIKRDVPETDRRIPDFWSEFWEIARHTLQSGPYFTHGRPGQFWLTVPTGRDRRTHCRLFVPKGLDPKKPVPIVVALHGAGGSENLFFEGYGAGHIVKECEKRGWLLLAPRSGGLFAGVPPVTAIVAKLAERYPIDRKRVFLVGHSMGAGQAVELVQENPDAFAAVALLGGVGRVRKADAFADLPVFIALGEKDSLALPGSRRLHKTLVDAGATHVTYKEYPDLEHMIIVREALPDVFTAWDAVVKAEK